MFFVRRLHEVRTNYGVGERSSDSYKGRDFF